MDPYVGTGSIGVAAAHHGAQVMGTDIDVRVVRMVSDLVCTISDMVSADIGVRVVHMIGDLMLVTCDLWSISLCVCVCVCVCEPYHCMCRCVRDL